MFQNEDKTIFRKDHDPYHDLLEQCSGVKREIIEQNCEILSDLKS
ncbi:hypothetical protein TrispH2_007184 [Trichoplax sp. H2]|nr:hypothetical protein TrispH2_007184 [Trichoplax sp. H2]|eukprot:RDD41762.1 hypothetical protein TrispH2_007184 [Trichoplax sp. H2]